MGRGTDMRDYLITVYGLVQGVGFRPFVAEAAREFSLSGTVCNIGGIVKIRAVGDEEALDEFIRRLSSHHLPGGRVDEVVVRESDTAGCAPWEGDDFRIVPSEEQEDELRFLPADIATCEQCERELLDPKNRRYRYPFISCVSCGPRFSIMEKVPYDRERSSMSAFGLCRECREDYERPGDRRRYAQTIACADCGPRLSTEITRAIEMIKLGKVVAVKDIGGYHFCFDPYSEEAAQRLREYKNREEKPLAVMFRDIEAVREMAEVSETEASLLTSPARPIVLLDKKMGKDFAPSVCGKSRRIGAMLPCNPLQILLLEACGVLVMTSGNRGGEPIVTEDERMLREQEQGFPDAVLSHDREIVNGLDDSIFQVVKLGGSEYVQILRRARGFVPEPVELLFAMERDTLAAGGDLKAVFALGRKNMAYLSGHFGDLEDVRSARARQEGIGHLQGLLGIHPERFVCDRHPGYFSVKKTEELAGDKERESREGTGAVNNIRYCQHHFAHVLSVMAEHGLTGKVLGLAFDGTGYGDDGTVWGSEFLLCQGLSYRRLGCFRPVPMTGGDAGSRDARLSCLAYLHEARKRDMLSEYDIDELLDKMENDAAKQAYSVVGRALDSGIGVYQSSSMGRLFDAVAALLGLCHTNTYEGECAERLQAAAEEWLVSEEMSRPEPSDTSEDGDRGYGSVPDRVLEEPAEIWAPIKASQQAVSDTADDGDENILVVDSVFLIAELARMRLYGEECGKLAFLFHRVVADASAELCERIVSERVSEEDRGAAIALGGGTMCNRLLLQLLIPQLEKKGYRVYLNQKVPCGDGGLALGQLLYSLEGCEVKNGQ